MFKSFSWQRVSALSGGVVVVSAVICALIVGGKVQAQTNFVCTDTDGGRNYNVKGTVKDNVRPADYIASLYTDSCSGSSLVEWECLGGQMAAVRYTCPNGCKDGACLKEVQHVCTDTDGGKNYWVKGEVSYDSSDHYRDTCLGYTLVEYSCGLPAGQTQPTIGAEEKFCESGCQAGACLGTPPPAEPKPEEPPAEPEPKPEPVAECIDSDGGKDYFVKGENTDFGDTRSDSCFNANTVTEFYCEQAAGQPRPSRGAEQKKCEHGCKDGACLAEPNEDDVDQLTRQKRLQEMIAGIGGTSSLLKGVSVLEKAWQQIVKGGIALPEDLAQIISRAKEISSGIKKFQNKKAENLTDEEAETLADNMGEMCEGGATLEEWGDQIPQLLQASAKTQQAAKDLKRVKSDVALAVKAATRSKYGIADKAPELNEAFGALKAMLSEAIVASDFEEKVGKISDFYTRFQDIYDTVGLINALQNVQKAKTDWGKRVTDNTRTISQLGKAKLDVVELIAKNDEIKVKLSELKTALARKPNDRDEVRGVFEDLKTLQAEFVDITDQLRGVQSALPKVVVAKFDTAQFKNFSVFSQFCGVTQSNDGGEEVVEN